MELLFCCLASLLFLIDLRLSSGFTFFVRWQGRSPYLSFLVDDSSSMQLEMAKTRKARRQQEKSRPKSFFDAIDEANGLGVDGKNKSSSGTQKVLGSDDEEQPPKLNDPSETARLARMEDAQKRMDARPDVSTVVVDEESGMEIVQQGKKVLDVVTRRAVKLSDLGPQYRLAQMFPGVPPPIRLKYRLDKRTLQVPEIVDKLNDACSVLLKDGSRGIPPHPSVANKAIDFVLANRDLMGYKMKRTLGRLAMRSAAASSASVEKGQQFYKLWKNFETLENHISAPFRQMLFDAEGRAGPQFGNLDVKSFLNGHLYERTANYLVLKAMVAHWEKKVIDADSVEKKIQTKDNYVTIISEGDPRRYLPEAPILFTLKECTQVCYMAQQMTKAFVETPELFDDLPPEVRFLEYATKIKGGTAMRKYMKEEFCPAEGITSQALREGMNRLMIQFENLQIDPYAEIVNLMQKLIGAMSVGSDDERDPYAEYLAQRNGPGSFPTYTFNHEELSLVRFFDNAIATAGSGIRKSGGLTSFFSGITASSSEAIYKAPDARAWGRPHELGWLDSLRDPNEPLNSLGKMTPGEIIPDTEEQEYYI